MKTILTATAIAAVLATSAYAGPRMGQPNAQAGQAGIGIGTFSVKATSASTIGNTQGNGNMGTVSHSAGTTSAASIGIASTSTASQTSSRSFDGAGNGSTTNTQQGGTVTEMFGTATSNSFSTRSGNGAGAVTRNVVESSGSAKANGGFIGLGAGINQARAFGGIN